MNLCPKKRKKKEKEAQMTAFLAPKKIGQTPVDEDGQRVVDPRASPGG